MCAAFLKTNLNDITVDFMQIRAFTGATKTANSTTISVGRKRRKREGGKSNKVAKHYFSK